MSTKIKNGEQMIITAKKTLLALSLLLLPMLASAQVDQFGKTDTLYAELAKIDNQNWSITISYTNDEPIIAFAIPLKMTAGPNRIVADSTIFTGGRIESFAFKTSRADTAIQCVTLGIIANLSPTHIFLAPGRGRIATIFVSSLDDKTIDKLVIDTTTTSPNNSLMVMADQFQGADTISSGEREKLIILPEFVIIENK